MGEISIILADDHALVRETLATWLKSEPDIKVVAAVSDANQAITEAIHYRPDILVLDIDMPGMLVFDAAKMVRARHPSCRIIFLSAFFHDGYIEQALASGAMGYLAKTEPPEVVAQAIRMVAAGEAYFSPEVQSRIIVDSDGLKLADGPRTRVTTLTPREMEVLRFLAQGKSKKEIAKVMSLSVGTVNNHTANLMKKLDIHDRVELTRYAIREGLVEA